VREPTKHKLAIKVVEALRHLVPPTFSLAGKATEQYAA
jgi:hypothetical protein